jgi:hypothetical protein
MLSKKPKGEVELMQDWYTDIMLHHDVIGFRHFEATTVRRNFGKPITQWRVVVSIKNGILRYTAAKTSDFTNWYTSADAVDILCYWQEIFCVPVYLIQSYMANSRNSNRISYTSETPQA